MPNFTKAEVTAMSGDMDLAPYRELLEPHGPGTNMSLPLMPGDRPRMVARALNKVAAEQGKRLRRIRTTDQSLFRFAIVRPGRRTGLTVEQIEARVAKARATRELNKAKRQG